MNKLSVLLIGDHRHEEFREPAEWLLEHTHLAQAADFAAALKLLRNGDVSPAIIVFAQARPGQYSATEIEQVYALAPLSRLVVLLGTWCEGETRTGQPLPGVARVYWHQWIDRVAGELHGLLSTGRTSWKLPRTATENEALLYNTPAGTCRRTGLIAIRARNVVSFEALSDACCMVGHSTYWHRSNSPDFARGAIAALWDASGCDELEAEELRMFAKRVAPAPLIALLNFPRVEDCNRARQAGAAAVVSKPFLLPDLWRRLDRAIEPAPTNIADTTAA